MVIVQDTSYSIATIKMTCVDLSFVRAIESLYYQWVASSCDNNHLYVQYIDITAESFSILISIYVSQGNSRALRIVSIFTRKFRIRCDMRNKRKTDALMKNLAMKRQLYENLG